MLTQVMPSSNVLSSVGNAVGTVVSVLNTASKTVPAGVFLKRKAATALTARLAWGALPLLGVGLAYWGFRTWQRQSGRNKGATAFPNLPATDLPAPVEREDESSWESFPASDAPSASPGASVVDPRSKS